MQSVNIGPVSVAFFAGEDGRDQAEIQAVSAYRDKFPPDTPDDAYFVAVEDGDKVVMQVSTTEAVELTVNEDVRNATPGTPDNIDITETCTTVTVKKQSDGSTTTAKFYLVVSSSLEEPAVVLVGGFDEGYVVADEEDTGGFFSDMADAVGSFFGSIFGGKEEEEETPQPQTND